MEQLPVFTILPPLKKRQLASWVSVGHAWVLRDGTMRISLAVMPSDGQLYVAAPGFQHPTKCHDAEMPTRIGPCPVCGKKMEYGDELPAERICAECALEELRKHKKK